MKPIIVLLILGIFAKINGASIASEENKPEYVEQFLLSSQLRVLKIVADLMDYFSKYQRAIGSLIIVQYEDIIRQRESVAAKLERNFERNVSLLSSLSSPECIHNAVMKILHQDPSDCYVLLGIGNKLIEITNIGREIQDKINEKYLFLHDLLKSCDQTKLANTKICGEKMVEIAENTREEVKADAKKTRRFLDQERKTLLEIFDSCQKTVFVDQIKANRKIMRAAKKCSVANSNKVFQNPEKSQVVDTLGTDNQTLNLEETTPVFENETFEVKETTLVFESETLEVEETTAAFESETFAVEKTTSEKETNFGWLGTVYHYM